MDWIRTFFESFLRHFLDEWKIGNIGEEINHAILQVREYFKVGELRMILTDAVVVMWIAVALITLLFALMSRKAKVIPGHPQTVVEMIVNLIISSAMSFGMTREEAEHILPMIGTLGLTITGCNIISIFKISPPAKNIAFPVAMAIIAIVYVIYISIRFVGIKGFWKSLTEPMPAMLPFKILDMAIKPVSLALRLFGNVFGAFVFMEFLFIIVPAVVPGVFSLWFDLADGILQAVVFSYLTMSYIGEIVEVGHELREHPEKFSRKKKQAVDSAA